MTLKLRYLIILALAPTIARAEDAIAPMALNGFTKLPPSFTSAKVMGQDGGLLGNVQSVQHDQTGKPTQIKFGMVGGKVITLLSNEVSYDEPANIVVTEMQATKAAMTTTGGAR